MENYKNSYPTDGLFGEEIIFFLLSLNSAPHLDGFYRKDVSVSLATTQNKTLTFFMHEIPELDKNVREKMKKDLVALSARALLVSCYEKLKNKRMIDDSPILEFFRHIRNGAAHDGKFDIRPGSLKKAASWGNKNISYTMSGNELFGDFFAIGDSMLFLEDVEAHALGGTTKWIAEEEPPIFGNHFSDRVLGLKNLRHWLYKLRTILLGVKKLFRK